MAFLISDLKLAQADMRSDDVQEIYSIASERYAVYRAKNRVRVMFADDPTEASRQRDVFAPLEIRRGEIGALMEGWVDAGDQTARGSRVLSYSRRLADGLILAFRELPDAASAALEAVRTDLMRERISVGRREYMMTALAVVVVWVILMSIFSRWLVAREMVWILTWVAGSGGFGALFSIMLNLSARQIQPDLLRSENLLDATLRVSIGAMSALILYALLGGRLVKISLQDVDIATDPAIFGLGTFVASVLAGFSERLVGNFLGGATLSAASAAAGTPAMDEAVSRSAAAAAIAGVSGPAGGPVPASNGVDETRTAGMETDVPDDLHIDGCACDVHDRSDDTDDVELPPARGGVAD